MAISREYPAVERIGWTTLNYAALLVTIKTCDIREPGCFDGCAKITPSTCGKPLRSRHSALGCSRGPQSNLLPHKRYWQLAYILHRASVLMPWPSRHPLRTFATLSSSFFYCHFRRHQSYPTKEGHTLRYHTLHPATYGPVGRSASPSLHVQGIATSATTARWSELYTASSNLFSRTAYPLGSHGYVFPLTNKKSIFVGLS